MNKRETTVKNDEHERKQTMKHDEKEQTQWKMMNKYRNNNEKWWKREKK